MSNIVDYIKWRGDLSFEASPMNEIDNLIMARISYLPFEKVESFDVIEFESLVEEFLKLAPEKFHEPEDIDLIREMVKSERFKNLKFSNVKAKFSQEEEIQFFAVTVWLPNGELFISFRGTDATLVGWKEDFNMSFMSNLPSQKEGVEYLECIAKKYPFKKIRLGGHSKGGNVAVYSGIFASKKTQNKIIEITSADGPGFDKEIIETDGYQAILDRIHTYIPQTSIIGRLLEHEEEYRIVESIQKGIMQHDIYSWQVEGPKIKSIEEVTDQSEMINEVVRNWLKSTSPEQRKNFVDIVFQILNTTKVHSVRDFSIKDMATIIDTYNNMEKDEKKEIKDMVKILFKTSFGTMKEEIPMLMKN